MPLRELEIVHQNRALVGNLVYDGGQSADVAALAHRLIREAREIKARQPAQDIEHIVPPSLLAIGDKVDAGVVLVLDGHSCRTVQPCSKLPFANLFFQVVEAQSNRIQELPAAAREQIVGLGVTPYDGRHHPALRNLGHTLFHDAPQQSQGPGEGATSPHQLR